MIPIEILVLIGLLLGTLAVEEFLFNQESNEDAPEALSDDRNMSDIIEGYEERAEGIKELLETQKD